MPELPGELHGKFNPKQDVDIDCNVCGKTYEEVKRSEGIPGVPATYIMKGEKKHERSDTHVGNDIVAGPDVKTAVVGRIDEFRHGEHGDLVWGDDVV